MWLWTTLHRRVICGGRSIYWSSLCQRYFRQFILLIVYARILCRYGVRKIGSLFSTYSPHHCWMTKTLQQNWHHHFVFFCWTYYVELSDEYLMVMMSPMNSSISSFALRSVNLPICLQVSSGMLLCLVERVNEQFLNGTPAQYRLYTSVQIESHRKIEYQTMETT